MSGFPKRRATKQGVQVAAWINQYRTDPRKLITSFQRIEHMLPARIPNPVKFSAHAALREIVLWTTKDGREIPLDQMSDDHIANAIRVLTVWRSRVRKRDSADPVVRELADAIDSFKRIQRSRRKASAREARPGVDKIGLRRR